MASEAPAAKAAQDQGSQGEELYHLSLNPEASETIVLLHGVLGSSLEYSYVIPHLASYHLLLLDLPGHSRSSSPGLTAQVHVSRQAALVADVIRRHAHGGKAHVVGLSMGGFVALELARLHPELCRTVFVTGAAPFEGLYRFMAETPAIPWTMMTLLLNVTPTWLYWKLSAWSGLKRHDQCLVEMRANKRWKVIKGVYSSILEVGWDRMVELGGKGIRVLTVAGGRYDDLVCTKRMGLELRKGGGVGCKAVVVRDAVHAWDLQFPELFADGVRAWIEGRDLPYQFEQL